MYGFILPHPNKGRMVQSCSFMKEAISLLTPQNNVTIIYLKAAMPPKVSIN